MSPSKYPQIRENAKGKDPWTTFKKLRLEEFPSCREENKITCRITRKKQRYQKVKIFCQRNYNFHQIQT